MAKALAQKVLKQRFQSFSSSLAFRSGTVQSVIAAGIVAGVNQLLERVSFECPCAMEGNLNCSSATFFCPTRDRYLYGSMFLFGPAVLLLFLGFSVNWRFWKEITGCFRSQKSSSEKETNRKRLFFKFCKAFGFVMITPLTWIILSLLDGDYLACALTALPYSFSEGQNCETPLSDLQESALYLKNALYSQIIGWILAIVTFFLGLVAYAVSRCLSSSNQVDVVISSESQNQMKKVITKVFVDEIKKNDPSGKNVGDALKKIAKNLKKDSDGLGSFLKELIMEVSDDIDEEGHKMKNAAKDEQAETPQSRLQTLPQVQSFSQEQEDDYKPIGSLKSNKEKLKHNNPRAVARTESKF